MTFLHITDGNHMHLFLPHERSKVTHPSTAHANRSHGDPVTRGRRAVQAQCGAGHDQWRDYGAAGKRRCFDELSTGR